MAMMIVCSVRLAFIKRKSFSFILLMKSLNVELLMYQHLVLVKLEKMLLLIIALNVKLNFLLLAVKDVMWIAV